MAPVGAAKTSRSPSPTRKIQAPPLVRSNSQPHNYEEEPLALGHEWGEYAQEEGSPYNDASEIMLKVHLARKSTKLDLSKMGLVEPLPKEVYLIYYLKQLILSDNCLICISPLVGNPYLQGLMQLNLANNCLTSLPEQVGFLEQMRFLYLNDNHLTELPESILSMTGLHTLTLHRNHLEDMPVCLGKMQWIEIFNCLDNPLLHVPLEAYAPVFKGETCMSQDAVTEAIRKARITTSSMLRVQQDVMAEAKRRLFGYLFRFYDAPNSRVLDLGGYGLRRVPRAVAGMTYLTDLSLAKNKLTSIPPTIRSLGVSLVKLDLSYNRLSSLPMDLRFLTHLEECSTEGMALEFLPKEIRTAGVKHLLRFINTMHSAITTGSLSLDNMDLTELPRDVLKMTNLTELYLDGNKIQELPSTLTVLRGLKTLSANDNLLRTIPVEVEFMDRLERISLLNCPIEDLPLGLCRMTSLTELRTYSHELMPRPPERISTDKIIEKTFNLLDAFEHMIKAFETKRLDLSDMELSFFPNEAFQISSLTELNIGLNKFEGVPTIIGNLQNLKQLNLAFNYLEQVNFQWEKLTALERLLLNNNQIRDTLTPSFGGLHAMRELIAHDNRFTTVPAEFCTLFSLRVIDFSFNEITHFPAFPSHALPVLEHVDLRHNRMREFPTAAFGHQASLKYIDVSFNGMRVFPSAGEWPREDDALSAFEGRCVPLWKLMEMHAQGVHVVDNKPLDRLVLNWVNVVVMRMHGNDINVLPWDLFALTSVQEMSYDAPLVKIPTQEIVIQGWGMMRAYLRRWHDARNSKSLDLSHFGLRLVPAELFLGDSLTRLDLSHNTLRGTLDANLSTLTRLGELDVSHNMLVDIHPRLLALTSLTANIIPSEGYFGERGGLRWHGNRWRSPPQSVRVQGTKSIFDYLGALTLGFRTGAVALPRADLRHFPYELLRLTQLTTLDLSCGNQLKVLPPTMTVLQLLQVLLVDDNTLFYIHPELGKLVSLRQLSMKHNRLEVLPHELSAIPSLKNLKYSGNPLTGPPEGTLVSVPSLEKIHADGGHVQPWMGEVLAMPVPPEATLVYLKNFFRARGSDLTGTVGTWDLDLRGLGLGHVPKEVADLDWSGRQQRHSDMTRLETIRLDHNPIAVLPESIRAWYCVRKLTLNNCMLRSIPTVLGNMAEASCLEHLEACDNGIRTLDLSSGTYTALTYLNLDQNDFTVLPKQLGWMSNLRTLSLRNNKITHLPASMWRMRGLKHMHLDHNKVQRIPPEIGAVSGSFPPREEIEMETHMEKGGPELDWITRPCGSDLPEMPPDNKRLSAWRAHCGGLERVGESVYGQLVDLTLDGNKDIWSPPPEIAQQGSPHQLRFLRALFDARHTLSCDLHSMGLLRMPPEVLELAWMLQSLWLSHNELETLPICIEELSALSTLHIHHNRITRIPPTVGLCLTNLTDLDISYNEMTRVPLEFANLKGLDKFEVGNNPWDMIADETIGQGTKSLLRFLQAVKDSIHGVLDVHDMAISSHGLTYVKRAIPDASAIHTLNMDDNLIKMIPKSMHILTSVTTLTINRNKLKAVPDWIQVYANLQVFQASNNHLMGVSESLGECDNLHTLFLNNNFIKHLPNSFASLTNLEYLRLDSNQLLVLNPAVGFMKSLRRLWLNLNELTCLPPELSYCTALHELKLDGNAIKSPPREILIGGPKAVISYLTKLMLGKIELSIELQNLKLQHFPFEITYMSNLTRLSLDNNRLKHLWPVPSHPPFTHRDKAVIVGGGHWAYRLFPEEDRRSQLWEDPPDPDMIVGPMDSLPTPGFPDGYPVHLLGNLVNLQSLSVRNNHITDLPDTCWERLQTSLRELYIDNNDIRVLPFGMNALDVLESFSHAGNPLGHPPINYEVEGFPTLRKYWKRIAASEQSGICELGGMSLLMFPPEFCASSSLADHIRHLDLSGNRIPRVDPNIHNMTALETLKLNGNLLTEVPKNLFNCECLIEINFDNNAISDIPEEIIKSTRLTYLSFCGNKLTRIPDEVGELTALRSLQLSYNELTLGTAFWLGNLTNLQSLALDHNLMSAVPVTVGMLHNLDVLNVEGNDLKDPPPAILEGGIKAIRNYLYYNVQYEYGGAGLAPPRTRNRVAQRLHVHEPQLEDACHYKRATASSTYNQYHTIDKALDGGLVLNSFWRSADRDDNVVVEVDLGTKFALQRIEIHWRSSFSPKRYTVELSEEGRQWFLVHRCIVDPAKNQGDTVVPGEEHITSLHSSYEWDRKDVVMLRGEDALALDSPLPSTGVRLIRVHMTARWFNSYRISFLHAWGNRIEGASMVSAKGEDMELTYRDA